MPKSRKQITFWKQSGLLEYMNIPHKNADLFVSFCGIEQCHPGHTYGKIRSEYHLHVVLSGCGTYTVFGQTWHLKRGDMFLVLPKTDYSYSADLSDPWRYAWIGLNGTRARQYLTDGGFADDVVTRKSILAPEQYMEDIRVMLECNPLDPADELRQLSALYHYLSLLINSNTDKAPVHRETYERMNYVNTAVRYMHENYQKGITVASTAAALHIDVSYLYRLFQDALQSSPGDYLTGIRMQQARGLLSDTRRSIQEIAADVGYRDAFTFSKCFRRENGMSPRAFRAQNSHLAP